MPPAAGGERKCSTHLLPVVPDLIRDPASCRLAQRENKKAGSRIKSGMTVEVVVGDNLVGLNRPGRSTLTGGDLRQAS